VRRLSQSIIPSPPEVKKNWILEDMKDRKKKLEIELLRRANSLCARKHYWVKTRQ
jgi:hypothetical protein